MSGIFKELIERRVFRIVALYVGGLIALLEFTDLIVERYGLSEQWVDLVLVGLLSLLPAVIMLAYYHGRPGKDTWHRNEKVGIPLNLIATGIILVTLYNNTGEPVSEIRQATMDGETITRTVVKEAYRKDIGVFFFDSQLSDEESGWLSYGLPLMIDQSLLEHPQLVSSTMYNNYAHGMIWRSRRAGFEDPTKLPAGYQRELAESRHMEYFIRAKLTGEAAALTLEWELFQVTPYERIYAATTDVADPLTVAHQVAEAVTEQISLQNPESVTTVQIPLADRLSESMAALKNYILGKNELLLNNDHVAALAYWNKATEADPSFALAFYEMTDSYIEIGQYPEALEAVQQTLRHSYKLRDPERFFAQANRYELTGNSDKTLDVYETWIELYPDDTLAKNVLANAYLRQKNHVDDALALYHQSLNIDPEQDWLLQRMADLYIVKGDRSQATTLLEQYSKRFQNEYPPLIKIGDLKLQDGNLDDAKSFYTKGSIVAPEMVTPILRLVDLSLRTGDFDTLSRYMEEAELRSQAPVQHAAMLGTQSRIALISGRPREALEFLKQAIEVHQSFDEPIDILMGLQMLKMDLYVAADASDEAWSIIETARTESGPPINEFASVGALIYHLARNETDQAATALQHSIELVERYQRNDMAYLNQYSDGLISYQRGEYGQAIEKLTTALDQYFSSIQSTDAVENYYSMSYSLAEAQFADGQLENARATLQNILDSWPKNPQANVLLGDVLAANNQVQQSVLAYQQAADVWQNAEPDFQPAQELRNKIASLQPSGAAAVSSPDAF